ncbi:hypothetical protein ABI59_22940 [Acidobacteria bacterium Mor1]|nr:hypothetical protein ABI59_22940 [Acidobacteria bacterium Mor1]
MVHIEEILATSAAITGVFWTLHNIFKTLTHRRELKAMVNFHDKLFDKLSDPADVRALLESTASERLFDSLGRERNGNVHRRVLFGLQAGAVLGIAGMAMLALGIYYRGDEGFVVMGILLGALGMGFLLSSGISYRLSRQWGLLEPDSERNSIEHRPATEQS